MELFDEQGFANTSAVQIAKRARVTTRTFFRYFPDKQAVLFADVDLLRTALVQGVANSGDVAHPLYVVTRALADFDWEGLGTRVSQRQRDDMIRSHPDLLERELIKQHEMADAFTVALQERGVDSDAAELAARVGIQVFQVAYRQWLAAGEKADLATTVESALSRLSAIVSANQA